MIENTLQNSNCAVPSLAVMFMIVGTTAFFSWCPYSLLINQALNM